MSNVPVLNLTEGYQTPEKTVQQDPMLPALQNIPTDKSMNTIVYIKLYYLGSP